MKKWLIITLIFSIPLFIFGQSFNVGEKSLVYQDSSRNRPVKTEIWYPTYEIDSTFERITDLPFILKPTIRDANFIQKDFPLVLLSHGTGGNRFSLAWLAIALAEKGYIIAAPDHWGNTLDNKIPEYFVRYWERPLDISFLITQILADKSIGYYINKDKIGVAGFSFGGYTSLALAGADLECTLLKTNAKTPDGKKEFNIPELGDLRKLIEQISCDNVPKTFKDRRIKAFVALSPALGLGFNSTGQTKNIDSPVLIFGAENDNIAPTKTNAEFYSELIHGSEFILLKGKAGHYVFLNSASENLKKEAKKYYMDDKSVNRDSIHKKVEEEIIMFFQKSFNK
jgi:predicted dienelactone hydrolase